MRRQILQAAAIGAAAVTLLGAGAASADTLSWSTASATTYFCYNGQCGTQPLLVAQHSDATGTDFNASAFVQTPNGTAFAAADPGSSGLLADLHALVATPGAAQTPGEASFAIAMVQGVQVYKWTGGAYDIDPTMFVGSLDYHASFAPAGPSGILAGFALVDMSALTTPGVADALYNFGFNANGGITSAFQADCGTAGVIGLANPTGGLDRITSAPGVSPSTDTFTLTQGMTSCSGGRFHVENGDEFALWSKLYVDRSFPGILDASHTFSVGFDPTVSTDTIQTLAESVQLESYDYTPAPEPAVWALMILGFGAVGATLRRRSLAAVRA